MLLTFLFLINFVFAQENQGGTFSKQGAEYMDSGIIINTLVYDTIQLGEDITLYMTPYELTGKTLDSTDVDCRVGVVNPNGERLYLLPSNDNFTIIGEDDIWTAIVTGDFLNETGKYLFNWDCHDGLRGGYFSSHVLITPNGESGMENIVFFIAILILLYTLTLIFFFKREIDLAPFTALSGMALGTFGLYIINNGMIIYRDWFTTYLSYVTMGVGFGLGLWALISWIQNEMA